MSKYAWFTGAFAALLLVSGTALAQPAEREAHHALKAKAILGSHISIDGGQAVGTVDDILFSHEGSIEYLVVSDNGKYVLVPWEAAKFDYQKRTATVNITPEKFREVPTFTNDQWTEIYTPAFQTKIYTPYGLRPRAERRIERREGRP